MPFHPNVTEPNTWRPTSTPSAPQLACVKKGILGRWIFNRNPWASAPRDLNADERLIAADLLARLGKLD
jgi:hypothetical protein